MATIQDVPEPWASAMLAAGFEHGGRPSYHALARAAGIGSAETVRQAILGLRLPEVDTADAMADALGVDRLDVAQWLGDSREVRRPYAAPADASLLTRDEQQAINDLIRAIAKTRRAGAGASQTARTLRAVAESDPRKPPSSAARHSRRKE